MSTPIGRVTYGAWLDEIGETGRTDPAGLVASGWLAAKANGRPRYSATKSVNAWLAGEGRHPGVDNINAVLHALATAYNRSEPPATAALGEAAPAQAQPIDEAQLYHQQPERREDWPDGTIAVQQRQDGSWDVQDPAGWRWAGWWIPGRGWVTGDETEPVQADTAPAAATVEQTFEAMLLERLASMEDAIRWMTAVISPLAQLVEATEVEVTTQNAGAMVEKVQGIAQQYGWIPGPAVADAAEAAPARPDFYGGHVVKPDFAQMAADAEEAPE